MRILFGADVSTKEDTNNYQHLANQDAEAAFTDVLPVLKSADAVVVNLECAITDSDHQIKKFGPNIRAPFGTAELLKKSNINYVGIANNHVFDFGKPGLYDTVKELEKNNITYTGIGKNLEDARKDMIITDGKVKIAVIAVAEHEFSIALENRVGCREYDPYDTNDDIVEAKKNADFVVVMYHGGKEHCRYPSPRLVKACRSMVKHGADLVMCQHTHCIGCYEEFMGGHILYGQGNFMFVSKLEKDDLWNTSLLLDATFEDGKLKVDFIPVRVNGDHGIKLCHGEDKENILKELKERSKSMQDGSWKQGWIDYTKSANFGWYKIIPEEKKDTFAAYITCEAHLDMMREFYKTFNVTNELDD